MYLSCWNEYGSISAHVWKEYLTWLISSSDSNIWHSQTTRYDSRSFPHPLEPQSSFVLTWLGVPGVPRKPCFPFSNSWPRLSRPQDLHLGFFSGARRARLIFLHKLIMDVVSPMPSTSISFHGFHHHGTFFLPFTLRFPMNCTGFRSCTSPQYHVLGRRRRGRIRGGGDGVCIRELFGRGKPYQHHVTHIYPLVN